MPTTTENLTGTAAIRPFTVPVTPEAELEALRARVASTRWPGRELVADHSQGVQLKVIQELARYWAEGPTVPSRSRSSARALRSTRLPSAKANMGLA
jgi:hypothetical protein